MGSTLMLQKKENKSLIYILYVICSSIHICIEKKREYQIHVHIMYLIVCSYKEKKIFFCSILGNLILEKYMYFSVKFFLIKY